MRSALARQEEVPRWRAIASRESNSHYGDQGCRARGQARTHRMTSYLRRVITSVDIYDCGSLESFNQIKILNIYYQGGCFEGMY